MNKSLIFSIFVVFLVFSLTGCAKIAHMQELLTLKALSEEGERLSTLVDKENRLFEELLELVKNGQVGRYPDQKSVWMRFGEPVFETKVSQGDEIYTVWMYRYSTRLFGPEKVYLYFDSRGALVIYDYSPGGILTKIFERSKRG